MGVWANLFPRGRKSADPESDTIAKIAAEICRNLCGLGLYVDSKMYGGGFCEIVASSSQKMITLPHGKEASGIALLLAAKYDPPTLVFEEINSLRRGLGRQMVDAVFAGLQERPGVFARLRVDDLSPRQSDGRRWWEHVASSHPEFDWTITHDGGATHRKPAS